MKSILVILLCLSFNTTYSAILKFDTITSKVARNRSPSPVKVVQDISVTDELTGVSYSVRETLYIKNGDEIKIKVQGKDLLTGKVNTEFLYRGSQKFSFNGSSVSSSTTPHLFYTPLIYAKTPGGFKKLLLSRGILPQNYSELVRAPTSGQYLKNPFTHLSRTNGEISYAITQKLSTPSDKNPTLWVSTKSFEVNKIRLDSHGTIRLLNIKNYSKKIPHAKKQIIKWKNYTFNIDTVSVTTISKNKVASELSQASLKSINSLKNFQSDALETFYTEFR